MPAIAPTTDFVHELRERIESWSSIEWVADRAADGFVVVLFRRPAFSSTAIEGVRVPTADHGASDGGGGGRNRALLDAVVEIVDPAGLTARLHVPWADGLIPDAAAILWKGGAIAQSARHALQSLGTSAQGCEGAPL